MIEKKAVEYRGKMYDPPVLSIQGSTFEARPQADFKLIPEEPVHASINSTYDIGNFKKPRLPIEIGFLNDSDIETLTNTGLTRVLDMPIKFPGSGTYKLPDELAPLTSIIMKIANYEAALNPVDDYYCYLTVDFSEAEAGACLREAPCHVDGFQGARWDPKVKLNHTYTFCNTHQTSYFVQPFDFSKLDEKKHDVFWEMNRQVAMTNGLYTWRPDDRAITLMDAYCVHRGTEMLEQTWRIFVRLSYEVRIFDRLGNAHNPMLSLIHISEPTRPY